MFGFEITLPDPLSVFMVTGVYVPAAVAALLVPLRWRISRWVQSPADFIAVMLAVDIGLVLFPSAFEFLAIYENLAAKAALLLLGLVALGYTLFQLEPRLVDVRDVEGKMTNVPWLNFLLGWALTLGALYHHLAVFAGGPF